MGKSAIHNHLNTLRKHAYVQKVGHEYHLGSKFMDAGGFVRSRNQLYKIGRPAVRQLSQATSATCELFGREDDHGIYLFRAEGGARDYPERHTGSRVDLHEDTTGRTVLAAISESERRDLLEDEGQSIPSSHVESVREKGYVVWDDEEPWSIVAPIVGEEEEIRGAITVTVVNENRDEDSFYEEIPEPLLERATRIQKRLKSLSLQKEWLNASRIDND